MKLSCLSVASVALLTGTITIPDGAMAAEEVCDESATFSPDTSKYYTIYYPNCDGYLRQSRENSNQKCARNQLLALDTEDDAATKSSAHWRFEYESSTDQWSLVNRFSGLAVKEYDSSAYTKIDMWSQRGKYDITCEQTISGIDTEPITYAAFDVNFMPDSNSCFDSITNNCYEVEEVTEFQKVSLSADGVTVINKEDDLLYSLSDSLAYAGVIAYELVSATTGSGFLAGLVSIGWSMGATAITGSTEDDGIADILNNLAEEILDATEAMIAIEIASEGVTALESYGEVYRQYFTTTYPFSKHFYIDEAYNGDISDLDGTKDDLDDLAMALASKAYDYHLNIYSFFDSGFSITDDTAVAKGDIGFDLLKYSIVEALTMAQEALLLDAYIQTDNTCEDLMTLHGLENMKNNLQDVLQNTYDMLYDWYIYDCCSIEERDGKYNLYHGDTKILQNVGYANAESIKEKYYAELIFEVENLLYSIDTQQEYLDNFLDRTLEVCEDIRADSEVLNLFLTDDQNSAYVCRDFDETCIADAECCGGSCADDGLCNGASSNGDWCNYSYECASGCCNYNLEYPKCQSSDTTLWCQGSF